MATVRRDITAEYVRQILHYDPLTGVFIWKSRGEDVPYWWNGRYAGTIAGRTDKQGYRNIRINKISYKAHRIAWLYVYGMWPNDEIDHKNHVKTDNRIANLRDIKGEHNLIHQPIYVSNTSGYPGVNYEKRSAFWRKPWVAKIKVNKKDRYLGSFASFEEAVECRKAAEAQHYGEFARVA